MCDEPTSPPNCDGLQGADPRAVMRLQDAEGASAVRGGSPNKRKARATWPACLATPAPRRTATMTATHASSHTRTPLFTLGCWVPFTVRFRWAVHVENNWLKSEVYVQDFSSSGSSLKYACIAYHDSSFTRCSFTVETINSLYRAGGGEGGGGLDGGWPGAGTGGAPISPAFRPRHAPKRSAVVTVHQNSWSHAVRRHNEESKAQVHLGLRVEAQCVGWRSPVDPKALLGRGNPHAASVADCRLQV